MRILLVEDDDLLGDALQAGLRDADFAVDWVRDGVAADAALAAEGFSVVLLDLGLPRLSGFELLRRVRTRGDKTPVIVLTARDALDDRVRGLDLGADDYLVKPVALAELGARIRAVTRRASGVASGVISVGSIALDPASHSVTQAGVPIDLQPREFALLQALAFRAGQVLTRGQIECQLYEWNEALESNAIEVLVHRLRRKLGPECIRTVRGVGYMLPADD